MATFSKEELLKIAELSSLRLTEAEVNWLQDQLSKTIDYTEQLNEFKVTEEHESVKTINIFRKDKSVKKDSTKLLDQAPKTNKTYFVVPKILD